MAEYPAHLVCTHRLRGGRTVTIRPIRPKDDVLEIEFFSGLSEESRYKRFHMWVNAPSEKLIHFLTEVDYDRHLALVCTVPRDGGEELVGEARYVMDQAGTGCEFGIMIADSWQRTGIAGLLMDRLIRAARERGLKTMEGMVLTTNIKMLRFARALGFQNSFVPGNAATTRIVKTL